MTLRRGNPLLLFGLFALSLNIGLAFLLRYDHRPVVAAASCVDFLVSVPAIYYFWLIRTGAQPLITIVPVFLGGVFRAAYIAPVSGVGRMAAAAICECGIAWFLIRRGRQSLAARVMLSELTVLRYALLGWRMKPDVPAGAQVFSLHKTSGIASIFGLIAALSVIEAACVHLVVQRWSSTAAWIVTGLSIYGSLLLVALARSFALRPIVVTSDGVLIRSGLLWSAVIAPDNITRVATSSSTPDLLKLAPMAEPNLFLELREEITAEGLYGRRKNVRCIALAADEPGQLMQAIRTAAL